MLESFLLYAFKNYYSLLHSAPFDDSLVPLEMTNPFADFRMFSCIFFLLIALTFHPTMEYQFREL